MKTIILTLPGFFEHETACVNALFEHGMTRLHLRKPKATERELAEWIGQIAPPFRPRIVMHDHYALARTFLLGGIHLNGRHPEAPAWYDEVRSACLAQRPEPFTLSRSCHSIAELEQHLPLCHYLFLSPIFDSISKEGYGAAFSRQELEEARVRGLLSDKVYALGGVSGERLDEVSRLGFHGAAILGDLWQGLPLPLPVLLSRLDSYLPTH